MNVTNAICVRPTPTRLLSPTLRDATANPRSSLAGFVQT
jgi:hypothetical protein